MTRHIKLIQPCLPPPINLHPNLHTPKNHLLTPLKINAKLHNISILHRVRSGLRVRRTEPNMVKEGTRRRLYILDKPLSVGNPELAVPARNDFGLESYRRGGRHIRRLVRRRFPLAVPSDFDDLCASRQGTSHRREHETRSRRPRILVLGKLDRRTEILRRRWRWVIYHG